MTIKQIAEICGTSRGTVDRVINKRGKVKPETYEKIMKIVKTISYTPDIAGKSLAIKKKAYTIGILLSSDGNAFFDEVIRGAKLAESNLGTYGIKVEFCTMKGYDVKKQLELIEELQGKVNALVINPINNILVANAIDSLVDSGICVITVNNDIKDTKRLCYIGSDYKKGGETACGVLRLITGGYANIGIVAGSENVLGHQERIDGFMEIVNKKCPNFKISSLIYTDDDEIKAYELTKKMLQEHTEINTVFIVAGGVYGACRAIISMSLEYKIKVVTFDKTPTTVEMINKGVISATICQQPFTQGNLSIQKAFNYLVTGEKPEIDKIFMKNEIKIFENL